MWGILISVFPLCTMLLFDWFMNPKKNDKSNNSIIFLLNTHITSVTTHLLHHVISVIKLVLHLHYFTPVSHLSLYLPLWQTCLIPAFVANLYYTSHYICLDDTLLLNHSLCHPVLHLPFCHTCTTAVTTPALMSRLYYTSLYITHVIHLS